MPVMASIILLGSPCLHRRSSGWRRPQSYTALTVATRHFSRFPFTSRRLLRRCPDSVCNMLLRLGTGGGRAPCFRITRSWRHRSRRSAMLSRRGAAGGLSVDPDTAAQVHCASTVPDCLCRPTSRASARLSWGPSPPSPLH